MLGVGEKMQCVYASAKTGTPGKAPVNDIRWWGSITFREKPLRTAYLDTGELGYETALILPRGEEVCVQLETYDGYEVLVAEDTPVLCEGEEERYVWKLAKTLREGQVIWTNGTPDERYKDADWMKKQYIDKHLTQQQIADMLDGVSVRTVRLWIKKLGLQRGDSGALFGAENHSYKGDDVTVAGGYTRTHDTYVKTGKCMLCDMECETQIHHDDRNPIHAESSNLMELCPECHRSIHRGQVVKKIRRSVISANRYMGVRTVYPIRTGNGNVVCEGFILDMGYEFVRF